MNRSLIYFTSVCIFAFLTAVISSLADVSPASAKKTKRSVVSRQPASQKFSSRSPGQAEQMLEEMTQPNPRFLRSQPSSSRARARLVGVCRNNYGIYSTSYDRDYGECMDALVSSSHYDRPTMRRAGAALLISGH